MITYFFMAEPRSIMYIYITFPLPVHQFMTTEITCLDSYKSSYDKHTVQQTSLQHTHFSSSGYMPNGISTWYGSLSIYLPIHFIQSSTQMLPP